MDVEVLIDTALRTLSTRSKKWIPLYLSYVTHYSIIKEDPIEKTSPEGRLIFKCYFLTFF